MPIRLLAGSGVGRPGGARPVIDVAIGSDKPVHVLFDTGSLGLHVYALALALGARSGIRLTHHQFAYGFVNGVVLHGVEATATVRVGPLTTPQPVAIGVVFAVGCAADKPACPRGTIRHRMAGGLDGVLGVRLVRPSQAGVAVNPLPQLPGVSSWTVHFEGGAGTLVLGGRPLVGATVLHLMPQGASGALRYWSDSPVTCVTVSAGSPDCLPTLFDTGEPDPIFFGGRLAALARGPTRRVPVGLELTVAAPSGPSFWSFTTGTTSSSSRVLAARGHGTFNASIAAFFAQQVTFDVQAGTISFATPLDVPLPVPAALPAFSQPAAAGAGVWSPAGRTVDGHPAVYVTSLVPPGGGEAAGIAWMDTHLLSALLYSGSLSPGGGPFDDTAPIQAAQAATLVAAFNGGFLMKDAGGGYLTEGRVVVPLVEGAASLVIYSDGTVDIGAWDRDVAMTPDVVAVRQNLVPLVAEGQPTPLASGSDWPAWGNTCGATSCAPSVPGVESQWRSGAGITADGALLYVAGVVTPSQLAQLLVHAGAVRAMELDINPNWTVFATYQPPGNGPADPANGTALLAGMTQGPATFFSPSWARDFVTMSARAPTGAP